MKIFHERRMLIGLLSLCALYLLAGLLPPRQATSFDVNGFAQLPVLHGGRIKPLDTVARTSLLMLSGKQTVLSEGHSLSAIDWLMEVMFRPALAAEFPVFEINDPDVLGSLEIRQTKQRRFSWMQIETKLEDIGRQAMQAEQAKPENRSRFQSAVVNLGQRVLLYQRLLNSLQISGIENMVSTLDDFDARIVPPMRRAMTRHAAGKAVDPAILHELEHYHLMDQSSEFAPLPLFRQMGLSRTWINMGRGIVNRLNTEEHHPGVIAYAVMSDAWRLNDSSSFNRALAGYQGWLKDLLPHVVTKSQYEFTFNAFEPFYRSLILYLIVFLLVLGSWMRGPAFFNRAAFSLLTMTFIVHTIGLISRMILQGRPPVTNLYSSAIFVGWVAVLLGIVLERIHRNGIGSMVSGFIGFVTLIIAHHLATSGDTLEMMRAVLDSNFWLATHVVTITIGYGSTFLAGTLALVYFFRRWFDRRWTPELARTFEQMAFGIVCFSTLFSFVGTILGGIWADQSWGRFWGWDPKENGALMIVLWNVFILHARWGGYAAGENLMLLAIGGNIITALSWFGVNMLGIGLHSYGFMDKAFVWLVLFVISQISVIAAAVWTRPTPR